MPQDFHPSQIVPQSGVARGERLKFNSGQPWSEVDDRDLIWCVEGGHDIAVIANYLCRTPSEVRARIEELGLPLPHA
jgi:hypothetical protein